jgi:hypothetical protein
MGFFNILPYLAWAVSAALLLWILVDAFSVSKQYDEDFLMSSREGEE